MYARIQFRRTWGISFEEYSVVSFSFSKDVYTPYTRLTAKIRAVERDFSDICEILLYVNGYLLHFGMCDSLEKSLDKNGMTVTLSSSGFTSQLCRNQLEPGLKNNVSIDNLLEDYYTFPNITHEYDSSTDGYIFVKYGSTIWDGIVALTYKRYGGYPFVIGTNHVRMTVPESPYSHSYSDSQLLERGEGWSHKKIVSDLHMENINGEYGEYELTDTDAVRRKIVRHSFLELDRQFLNNPREAIEFRSKYSRRASEWSFCRYAGYNGEDISHIVSFGDVSKKIICAMKITGDSSGIETTLYVYSDRFFNT